MATTSPDMAVLAAASAGIDSLNSLISAMSSRSHQQLVAADTISQFQHLISRIPAKSGHARFRRAPPHSIPASLSPPDLVASKSDIDVADNTSPTRPSDKNTSLFLQIDLNAPPSRESSDSDCSSPPVESAPSANPNSIRDETAASISGSNHFDLNMEASQYSVNSTSVFPSPFKISNCNLLPDAIPGICMLREGSNHGVSSMISEDNACFEGSTSKKVLPRFLLQKTGNGGEDSSSMPRSALNATSQTPSKVDSLKFNLSGRTNEMKFESHCSDDGQSTECTEEDSGFAGTVESGLHSEFALVNYKPMNPSSKINTINHRDQNMNNGKVLSSCITSEVSWPSSVTEPMQKFSLTVMDHSANSLKRKSSSKPDSQCHCAKRKKSKNKVQKIVPAISEKIAEIPPDDHSWRKYGQKPIKGSPYPRGYYKCSGMKGCPAKKHVERSLDNPSMLIVTYEGEHIHARPTSFEAPVKVT